MITPITSGEQWHALRAKHIGSSEVAALANLSPWATAYSLYQVKAGAAEQPPVSDDVKNGIDFEEAIARRYAIDNNLEFVKCNEYNECASEPMLGATLDYKFSSHEGKNIAVEIKHVRSHSWRHHGWSPDNDYMPPHIEMQLVAQLLCTGWDEGRVVAFCDGEYYSFTRSINDDRVKKIAAEILRLVGDMKRRLAERDAPDAFGAPVDLGIMGLVAPSDVEKPVIDLTADADADALLHYFMQAKDQARMADKSIDEAKAKMTQLYTRASNEPSVPAELMTQHYHLKRTVSTTPARVQTVKAATRVLFTIKERMDVPNVEPKSTLMAG